MAPKSRDVWGIPIPDAKDVVSYISNAMNTLSIASGDKPALTPGASAVRRSGEAVSYVNSAINPFAETSKKLIGQAAGKPGANKALAKSVGVDAAVALTAALGGKAVQKVANAYKEAKSTVQVNNVLIHGGAGVLEGGVINPKFVQGNTVELNQQALSRTENVINQYQKNVNFTKEQVAIPGSYAYNNKSKSLAQIAQGEKAIADTKKWVEIAKRDNYFSAVDDANSAYGFKGAYHVVKPPKQNVSVQFGPSGEYQVAGSQKPVKSFSTVGKTLSEQSDIAKKVNAYADRLRQQQIKKEAIKQALKNIRK
jgi:hypothetical protein